MRGPGTWRFSAGEGTDEGVDGACVVTGTEARVVEEHLGGWGPGWHGLGKGMRRSRARDQRQRSTWWSGSEPGHGRDKGKTSGKGSWRRPGSSEDGLEVQVTVLADGADAGRRGLGSFGRGEGVGQNVG